MYFGSKQGINTIFVAKTNSFDLSPNTFDPSPNTNDFDSHSTVFPSICEAFDPIWNRERTTMERKKHIGIMKTMV